MAGNALVLVPVLVPVLVLVLVEAMSAKAMDGIRARALTLEKSAHQRSKTVYGATAPAKRLK